MTQTTIPIDELVGARFEEIANVNGAWANASVEFAVLKALDLDLDLEEDDVFVEDLAEQLELDPAEVARALDTYFATVYQHIAELMLEEPGQVIKVALENGCDEEMAARQVFYFLEQENAVEEHIVRFLDVAERDEAEEFHDTLFDLWIDTIGVPLGKVSHTMI